MKRLIAKLLSFLLMLIMLTAVTAYTSENFPAVQKITKLTANCAEDGSWNMGTVNKGTFVKIPHAGRIMEAIAQPKGFVICMVLYFILLLMGRKKNQRKNSSDSYRNSYDKFYESLADVSVAEASDAEDVSDTSLAEISLPETS